MGDAGLAPAAGPAIDAATIRVRLGVVEARIAAAGADPRHVDILAVTKGHSPSVVALALDAGLRHFGENYAQELVAKSEAAGSRPDGAQPAWHFIGRLQTNKVRLLAPHVTLWQSIDRPQLLGELARRCPAAHLLIQVNATDEPAKGGCEPLGVTDLVARARDLGLVVEGLMTVGPTDHGIDPRPGFELVRGLVDRLGLARCSMGMSDDLEAAVRCGSTMVRVGTALFGTRTPP